ncbi:HNH endonuclease domain-containing protein [Aliikangiella sp. IMCC44632]
MSLPDNSKLPINKLSQIFKDTTNSYKLLFFGALLNKISSADDYASLKFAVKDLANEMLLLAWYPSVYSHLSFGAQDQVAYTISKLSFNLSGTVFYGHSQEHKLRNAIADQRDKIQIDRLLRYVPYRLLTPFFKDELIGLKDGARNSKIYELAIGQFDFSLPIYKFSELNSKLAIEIHPLWYEYFISNLSIIQSWFSWHWCKYLQLKNPHVPAIIEKAFPPKNRSSLAKQTNYWKVIMQKVNVKCIYSGKLLNNQRFELDHFLPWSFVNHNQAWNLVPVIPSANSAKSNSLPHNKYLKPFIYTQHLGLSTVNDKSHKNTIDDYMSGLKLRIDELKEFKALKKSYIQTLRPLETIAKRMGFKHSWIN